LAQSELQNRALGAGSAASAPGMGGLDLGGAMSQE